MYVDVLTYDVTGTHLYYANRCGVLERYGLFQFPNGDTGYANPNATLDVDKFIQIIETEYIYYFQSNGHAVRGTTITDGDGHLISTTNPNFVFNA